MDNSRSDKGSDDESDPEEQDPFKDSSSDSDGEGCHSSSSFIKAFGGSQVISGSSIKSESKI